MRDKQRRAMFAKLNSRQPTSISPAKKQVANNSFRFNREEIHKKLVVRSEGGFDVDRRNFNKISDSIKNNDFKIIIVEYEKIVAQRRRRSNPIPKNQQNVDLAIMKLNFDKARKNARLLNIMR